MGKKDVVQLPTPAHISPAQFTNRRAVEEKYAGIIKAPEAWWLSESKLAYDAWDWPDGPARDLVLSAARHAGLVHYLGPSSMSSAQAMAAAKRVFGVEDTPDEAFRGFTPNTPRGREFLAGTGDFAQDESGE